ncbi:MAG: hypothetical protein I3273_00270 [Candidatus Moeniiplasma glomeromycotorum]|nr:hypothetical protein [Candidatus Moeniiplasma glomeromycotorum]MCE8167436.1 hypothetical protein [Candidatus Moeniiplasma glomeromycotorum]MCE8168550.1 hypothetical protein [Candidatus Moeniiplasma glomeromycotorum]
MVEKTEFLLYKLEEPLRRIEKRELKKQGEKEKYIQDLLSENLSSIFSNLIFLAKECELESVSGERGAHRLDTLAFDKDKKCFVIIEYKRDKSSELASQIKTYLDCLDNVDNQYSLLKHLNNKIKKNFHRTEIEWEETKGICIATEIDRRASWVGKDKSVKIIEIKFFDDILYIDTRELPKWLKINLSVKSIKKADTEQSSEIEKSKVFSIENVLSLSWLKPEAKDWLNKIRKIFLFKRWLDEEIKSINDKSYYVSAYYWEKFSKKKLFSLLIGKNSIWIQGNWPLNVPPNLKELLNDYGVKYEKKGQIVTGDWYFPSIRSNEDFQNLANFFSEYKEKFSENQ